ncbi:MAG: three-Cys-motif partner protein TcmP [Phycisphaerae bacterium]
MSSIRHSTVWKAAPHTKAKIALLQSYLERWFQILGVSRPSQNLLYIDGFAGPGEYTNFPTGSPIAALNAAERAVQLAGSRWIAGNILLVFIDQNADAIDHLKKVFGRRSDANKKVKCLSMNEPFTSGIDKISKDAPKFFTRNNPTFAFVDPFGPTAVPFSCVQQILSSPCSEMLLNFDADGVDRIRAAGHNAKADVLLSMIYGDDSWRHLQISEDPHERCRLYTELYKKRLRSIDGVKYVFAFEMRGKADRISYYLIFATRHPLGLEKMKESMRKIRQAGEYRFSDAHVGQLAMFEPDADAESRRFSEIMLAKFKGQSVEQQVLNDYALNESPFDNANAMLRFLEMERLIEVVRKRGSRKSSYNQDAVECVRFLPPPGRQETMQWSA